MAHEQSRTTKGTPLATPPPGQWINVYGPGTLYAGQQLPGTPTYPSVGEADTAARIRSLMQNVTPGRAYESILRLFQSDPQQAPQKPPREMPRKGFRRAGAEPIFPGNAKLAGRSPE